MRTVCLLCCLALLPAPVRAQPSDVAARRTPIVRVFEAARDAVVNISTSRIERYGTIGYETPLDAIFNLGRPMVREREVSSVGSGFIVHPDGYVVTNAHVVAQTDGIQVSFADGRKLKARPIAVDPDHDVAVLKLESDGPFQALALGHSDDLMIGETVVAIGNPLGYQHTVTSGIVSALDRELRFSEDLAYRNLIQTDAAINPGNSGGPLLNINGELIGVNTAIRGDAQNVGFAIPVDELWNLLPELLDLERRERVRLGLTVAGPRAEIREVRPDTPAAQAGLQRGDRIVAVNGEQIRSGIDYYVHLLNQQPGDEVRLRYARDGRESEAQVKLEVIPPPDGQRLAKELFGIRLEPASEVLRDRWRFDDEDALVVTAVDPRSPGDRAGMAPGDLLLRVDRYAVSDPSTLGLVLEGVSPGERVVFEGIRLRHDPPFRWRVGLVARR